MKKLVVFLCVVFVQFSFDAQVVGSDQLLLPCGDDYVELRNESIKLFHEYRNMELGVYCDSVSCSAITKEQAFSVLEDLYSNLMSTEKLLKNCDVLTRQDRDKLAQIHESLYHPGGLGNEILIEMQRTQESLWAKRDRNSEKRNDLKRSLGQMISEIEKRIEEQNKAL